MIHDDIKRRLPHDEGCDALTEFCCQRPVPECCGHPQGGECCGSPDPACCGQPEHGECNCPRRDLIAYLERLEEPTTAMAYAGYEAGHDESGFRIAPAFKAMLKAAEEDAT